MSRAKANMSATHATTAIIRRTVNRTRGSFMAGPRREQSVRLACRVGEWRGGLGPAYPFPALSSAGASLARPCFRFHSPLIEPGVRISRTGLSDKVSRVRPQEVAPLATQADQAQHLVQV